MTNHHEQYRFKVVSSMSGIELEESTIYLLEDNWDDWFTYETTYYVIVCSNEGVQHRVGLIKIGQSDMIGGQRRPNLPREFVQLDMCFFSLGQESSYYECVNGMGQSFRESFFQSVNDIAADPELWNNVKESDLSKMALFRGAVSQLKRVQNLLFILKKRNQFSQVLSRCKVA